MISILHVIDHLGSGGAQTALLNLLKYRDQTAFSHMIAVMHGRGAVAEEFETLGVKVMSLSPAKWPPAYMISLPRLLQTESFDIVHTHLFGANWLARPLARLAGCRTIFTHDQCNDAMRDNPLFLLIDQRTNSLADRILAVSRSTVRFLETQEHLSAQQVEYFPNGVDLEAFPLVRMAARSDARRKWGLPVQGIVIGGVGRLVPQKDFSTFLQTAALLAKKYPDVHFAIFGDGPQRSELRKLTSALGLEGRVSFLGYVRERTDIYAAIDVLFLTSRYEGTPMVLLEAMSSGVGIAATAVDGTAEILSDGVSARLFPVGSPGEAARALECFLQDVPGRVALADRARQCVMSHYNAKNLMRRLESFYVQSVNENKSPQSRDCRDSRD